MDSFTIELVSNASSELFPKNTLSSFTNSLPEQVNLEGQWEVAVPEISYPSMYQNVAEGKFLFHDDELSKTKDYYYLEPGLDHSITDIVQTMNSLIQNRNNHSKTCIGVKVDCKTQKIAFSLVNDESSLVISSIDLGHFFGGDVRNDRGILMLGRRPHKPLFACDIVRSHSPMIYSDFVEYNIVRDTKAHFLRCFPFISKVKSGDVITTEQYMKYQTISNLQFRRLLKNSFHSVKIDLRDTSGKKIPFVSVGITRLVLMFRKMSDFHF